MNWQRLHGARRQPNHAPAVPEHKHSDKGQTNQLQVHAPLELTTVEQKPITTGGPAALMQAACPAVGLPTVGIALALAIGAPPSIDRLSILVALYRWVL